MQQQAPPVRDLVLVGGGHSHVQVLKSFGMRPLAGVRVTIVSRELNTPYSGMLPGFVAGFYPWRDIHIDLGPLANFAQARLVNGEVVGLGLDEGRIKLRNRPDLHYDILSINSGAVPVGVGDKGIPVKPIGRFLPRWDQVKRQARSGEQIVIVGGGAGGVELALAMRQSLAAGIEISLITERLLDGYNRRVRNFLSRELTSRGVRLTVGVSVEGVEGTRVYTSDGQSFSGDYVFWVTGVQAPAWPGEAGLATQAEGFIEVHNTLASVSHPEVFATGDIAALTGQPRPKAGVFAVREGPVLADNLRRALTEKPLRVYRAQKRFLSLIGTGDGRAVASKGPFSGWGRWAWRWKDHIDRKFMERFTRLPEMQVSTPNLAPALQADAPDAMRCGGCGAKLGADPLARVLARLPSQKFEHVRLGIGDDAAVLEHRNGNLALTVDGFRSLVTDPYLFGRIAAHHSLNDIFAMGARGTGALALATVPLMAEIMME
ncbi:MAG: FAD-dependent oxidoreductase, partial [Gammaproteobacteria bacterium]|nr:FAD-dependent oxidoreductase [Gammaproteobacteria bacterium]